MREIGVTQIKRSNPMLSKYMNTISFWDQDGNFISMLKEDTKGAIKDIFGVFYGEKFLGASALLLDPISMEANIHTINGSLGHKEEIEEVFTQELREIAVKQYGATSVTFNGKKEQQPQVVLVK